MQGENKGKVLGKFAELSRLTVHLQRIDEARKHHENTQKQFTPKTI
jgi:hypothetical protein